MEQRAAHRFPTDLEADCRSCSRAWTSRLCNISATGCMITCPEPSLPDGALLRLRLRSLTAIDCQIVWQNRGHAGIRFNVPLHMAVMEHLGFREPEQEPEPEQAPEPQPEPESFAAAAQAQSLPGPRRALSGLDARLVKRTWQDERDIRIAATG